MQPSMVSARPVAKLRAGLARLSASAVPSVMVSDDLAMR